MNDEPRTGTVLEPDEAPRGTKPAGSGSGFGGGFAGGWSGMGAGGPGGAGPGHGVSWSAAGSGRDFPWLGVILVVLGAAFLLQQVFPGLTLTTLILLALAVALVASVVVGARWLLTPAVLLVALVAARLGRELGLLPGEGWTALFLGLGLLALWGIARAQGRNRSVVLLIGVVLTIAGVVQLAGRVVGFPDIGVFWPLVLVAAGLFLILGSRGARPATPA